MKCLEARVQAEQGGKEIRSENQPSCMGPIDRVRTSAFTGSKRESSREFGQRKDIIQPFLLSACFVRFYFIFLIFVFIYLTVAGLRCSIHGSLIFTFQHASC